MDFNLNHHLEDICSRFPEGRRKPVVGLTSNHHEIDADLRERYYQQVVAAGGVPVIIPPVADADVIIETLERIDALILTGGADHNPRWMGEEPSPLLGNVNEVRDLPELLIARLAYNRQIPILGICRGIQTMAIAFGGHVAQDISEVASPPSPLSPQRGGVNTIEGGIKHSQKEEREVKTHSVVFAEDSILANIYNNNASNPRSISLPLSEGRGGWGERLLSVNSFHHQVVDRTGNLFHPVAWSADGLIEAIESSEFKPMMGVQWHPEWLGEEGRKLFEWLVGEAEIYHHAKTIHDTNIILDSHCDTPMFFPQGADFSKRDPKILVDVHKMADGRQDVATMVAYVPQPVDNQTWADVMPFATSGPKAYADLIFDKINDIIDSHPDQLSLAWDFNEVWENYWAGRKSIMIGIENGLAIEDDLDNIQHFAERGVIYITLCHNGDNQICDSARKSLNTWGGVSPFGRKVIQRMNKFGLTVDLSHAGEKSFYDAIAISKTPVVCSHSNCKALCNHERNLTDDQLRALAKNGGVCQITLYEGFVSENPSEADILKAIDHLNHAVRIMGIDHVGFGSDFDGDGGIRGIKDSSEMMLFTRQLLKNRYSDDDIAKIWGGNWIRVIDENLRNHFNYEE